MHSELRVCVKEPMGYTVITKKFSASLWCLKLSVHCNRWVKSHHLAFILQLNQVYKQVFHIVELFLAKQRNCLWP